MEKGCRGIRSLGGISVSDRIECVAKIPTEQVSSVYFFAARECKKKYFISFFAFITRNDKCNAELTYSKMYKKRILSKKES